MKWLSFLWSKKFVYTENKSTKSKSTKSVKKELIFSNDFRQGYRTRWINEIK